MKRSIASIFQALYWLNFFSIQSKCLKNSVALNLCKNLYSMVPAVFLKVTKNTKNPLWVQTQPFAILLTLLSANCAFIVKTKINFRVTENGQLLCSSFPCKCFEKTFAILLFVQVLRNTNFVLSFLRTTHSSLDSFAPSILLSHVRIPSTPSMPLYCQICTIFVIVLIRGRK